MKERPIIFSAPMVRAILSGTKTQTRRVVRKQFADDAIPAEVGATTPEGWLVSGHSGLWWDDAGACLDDAVHCPFGMPGDRLWLREAWAWSGDGAVPAIDRVRKGEVWFRADPEHSSPAIRWRPSIHMPRWASRITLKITAVRIERLQDISEADAIAEGIDRVGGNASCSPWKNYWLGDRGPGVMHCSSAVTSYRTLWDCINGPGSWDANPWVWVVEFKRINQASPQL